MVFAILMLDSETFPQIQSAGNLQASNHDPVFAMSSFTSFLT